MILLMSLNSWSSLVFFSSSPHKNTITTTTLTASTCLMTTLTVTLSTSTTATTPHSLTNIFPAKLESVGTGSPVRQKAYGDGFPRWQVHLSSRGRLVTKTSSSSSTMEDRDGDVVFIRSTVWVWEAVDDVNAASDAHMELLQWLHITRVCKSLTIRILV